MRSARGRGREPRRRQRGHRHAAGRESAARRLYAGVREFVLDLDQLALYSNPGYDVRSDFVPIGIIAQMGVGIVSHPDFPAKSVADLVALAKKQPGKLSFGTSPPGSGSHLAAELFKAMTGIDVTLVPYKGAAALTTDLLGGHIPVIFSVMPPALGNIQNGKLHVSR